MSARLKNALLNGVLFGSLTGMLLFFQGAIRGPSLSDRGGVGEACYPNDTCRGGLSCFQVGKEKECHRDVQIVGLGEKSCYELVDPDGKKIVDCFASNDACQHAFSTAMQGREVVRGCSR